MEFDFYLQRRKPSVNDVWSFPLSLFLAILRQEGAFPLKSYPDRMAIKSKESADHLFSDSLPRLSSSLPSKLASQQQPW